MVGKNVRMHTKPKELKRTTDVLYASKHDESPCKVNVVQKWYSFYNGVLLRSQVYLVHSNNSFVKVHNVF